MQDSVSEPDGQGRTDQFPTGISQIGSPLDAKDSNLRFAYLVSFQGIKNAPAGMTVERPITAPPVHRLPGKGKKLSKNDNENQLQYSPYIDTRNPLSKYKEATVYRASEVGGLLVTARRFAHLAILEQLQHFLCCCS